MKNKSFLISILMIISSFIMLSSCVKGPAGEDGNANVIVTQYTIPSWIWVAPEWMAAIYWDKITSKIIENGAILVYAEINPSEYAQLPVTYPVDGSYSESIFVSAKVGSVTLSVVDSDLLTPNYPGQTKVKIVLIEGNYMKSHPEVNYSNYREVKRVFGLED